MAEPTVNSRPNLWSGTSLPILYKFTSTNYSNAGYYMAVEIWDSVSAVKIADAKFYSNSSGIVWVDVSEYLKSNLSLDNDSNLASSDVVYTESIWMSYYIKYQEIWTASSESQVNDSANVFNAVYGGLGVGISNYFTDYFLDPYYGFLGLQDSVAQPPTLPYQRPKAVLNYPFTYTFFAKDGWFLKKLIYDSSGAQISETNTEILSDGFHRGKHRETGSGVRLQTYVFADNDNGGSSTRNVSVSGTGTSGSTTDSETINWYLAGTTSITYSGNVTIYGPADGADIARVIIAYNYIDGTTAIIVNQQIAGTPGNLNIGGTLPTPTKIVESIYIEAFCNFGGPNTNLVGAGLALSNITSGEEQLSEELNIDIEEECPNTIVLQWKNHLGGDECFPFFINQEYTHFYGNRKAKRLTLYAENLTLNQWEAIQGLYTTGEIYKNNITEMTTSINRTSSQVGQSAYVYNSDGTKTGVIVIPAQNTTNTKQEKHSAFVTIEYPEIFLQ